MMLTFVVFWAYWRAPRHRWCQGLCLQHADLYAAWPIYWLECLLQRYHAVTLGGSC